MSKRKNSLGHRHLSAQGAGVQAAERPEEPAVRATAESGAEDFDFNLLDRPNRWSDERLLEHLRAFSRKRGGEPFGQAEFQAWPERICTPLSISRRFGGWRRALSLAGLRYSGNAKYDAAELIERLERAWRAAGRRPGLHALRKHADVTIYPYQKRWGTYRRVCTLFVQYKKGQITLKELMQTRLVDRRALSRGVRWKVLKRDGHRCRACGRNSRRVVLEVDHIVPVCRGGTNRFSNLQTLCRDCNRGKGGRRKSVARKGNRGSRTLQHAHRGTGPH